MFNLIKSISPESIKKILRTIRCNLYSFLDKHKSYLSKIRYCNYDLYYTRGSGLINRIRFGNPNRIYEPELIDKIYKELINIENPKLLDIGTNIGLISINLLSKLPNLTIYGFEPTTVAYKSLSVTIFANQLEKILILSNKAVDSTSGEITFYQHSEEDSSGDGFIDTKRSNSSSKEVIVETIALDEWWVENNKPKIDVIKIDIEGGELRAFRGANKLIDEIRPIIFMEISEENLRVYPYNAIDILEFFNNKKYEIISDTNTICNKENFKSILEKCDTFIVKPY